MKITRIGHSGFLVEFEKHNLIFDFYTDKAGVITPEVFKDKRTTVFVSHTHGDHFNKEIFEWAQYGDVAYVLDSACYAYGMEKNVYKLDEGESFAHADYGVSVRTFGSTDEGVSFLVKVRDTHLFHSGDLNCWYWADEKTPEELKASEDEYLQIIRQLPVGLIDVAFVPEDPRLGEHAGRAVKLFQELVKPARIIPMHFPGGDGETV